MQFAGMTPVLAMNIDGVDHRDIDGRSLHGAGDIDDFGIRSPDASLGKFVQGNSGFVIDVEAFVIERVGQGIPDPLKDAAAPGQRIGFRILAHHQNIRPSAGETVRTRCLASGQKRCRHDRHYHTHGLDSLLLECLNAYHLIRFSPSFLLLPLSSRTRIPS